MGRKLERGVSLRVRSCEVEIRCHKHSMDTPEKSRQAASSMRNLQERTSRPRIPECHMRWLRRSCVNWDIDRKSGSISN
jgi:hypothetical protein